MNRSKFKFQHLKDEGIPINALRTLMENTIFNKNIESKYNEQFQEYNKEFKKVVKQNKKVEKYYKKIEKLKSKIANIYGIEYLGVNYGYNL